MARYIGFAPTALFDQTGTDRFKPYAITDPPPRITAVQIDGDDLANLARMGTVRLTAGANVGNKLPKRFNGFRPLTHSDDFFERIYILPRSIDAGVIVSDQVYEIEVFNAYRLEARPWSDLDDSSLGEGISLDPLPPPPTVVLERLQGSVHDLTISLDGPPSIDGTLDFVFDVGTFELPIVGQRSVLFPFEPSDVVEETLVFVTDVIPSLSGKEQRRSLRWTPRSVIGMSFELEGAERRLFDNLIFGAQDRAFGLPIWYEASRLTTAIVPTDTTIDVSSTDYADFRVGGLAVVWSSAFDYEVLEIESLTATTITFASAFTGSFDTQSLVMPVRIAYMGDRTGRGRRQVNLQQGQLEFTIVDNDVDLSDLTPFSTYNSKVLLDDYNLMEGDSIQESILREVERFDSEIGAPVQQSSQPVSAEGTVRGFVTTSRQELWELRGLLHGLRGRAVSFYLPTFYPDFEVVEDVAPADQAIDVSDVNYTDSVQSRSPRNVVRLHKSDGTSSAPKLVVGSTKPSAGVERLSITPDSFGVTVAVADVSRLELIQKVRFDSDRLRIRHLGSDGEATLFAPVRTVLE